MPQELSQKSRQQLITGLLPTLSIDSDLSISFLGHPQEKGKGITVNRC